MKIAVLSDIHANLVSLKEVINDIKSEGCEKVFCLGDIVLAGPQPKETIDFVKEQDWTIVQGNTDNLIVNYGDEVIEMMQNNFPIMGNALSDDMKYLDENDVEFLESLPTQLEAEIEGIKILFVHGSPRANNEDILPNMPIEKVEEIIADTTSDLIFCGHTHIPCGYQTNKKQTVVNVGSVGRPMSVNPFACYVIAEINDGKFEIRHKFIDYDRKMASDLIIKRDFEGAESLAKLITNPESRHV